MEIPGRGRWYRTGDGGMLRGKELEVVGRFDSQVLQCAGKSRNLWDVDVE